MFGCLIDFCYFDTHLSYFTKAIFCSGILATA